MNENTNEYVTVVFHSGYRMTRRIYDLFPMTNFLNSLTKHVPTGRQVLVNWDNVEYLREATPEEIADCLEDQETVEAMKGGTAKC